MIVVKNFSIEITAHEMLSRLINFLKSRTRAGRRNFPQGRMYFTAKALPRSVHITNLRVPSLGKENYLDYEEVEDIANQIQSYLNDYHRGSEAVHR